MQPSLGSIQEDDELVDTAMLQEDESNFDSSPSRPSTNPTSSASSASSFSKTPPLKWRYLREIYEQTKRSQTAQVKEPSSFEEAMRIDQWREAMDEEMKANKT